MHSPVHSLITTHSSTGNFYLPNGFTLLMIIGYHLTHGQFSIHQILNRIPVQILRAPSLHSSFSPILCFANSSCISSLELQLSLFNSPRPWFSDWLLPPVLLCRNCLQAESWTNHSAHLTGCPSLRGHRTLLQDPTSKNSNFIYFFSGFMVVSNGRINATSLSFLARSWNLSFIISFSVSVVGFTILSSS